MKNFIITIILTLFVAAVYGQDEENNYQRSAGFFFSPGITSFIDNSDIYDYTSISPRSGIALGYRYNSTIGNNFFLEGGISMLSIGANYNDIFYDYNYYLFDEFGNYTYVHDTTYYDKKISYFNITTPFLLGYHTNKGSVRLHASAGFSFNLAVFQSEENIYPDDYYNYYYEDDYYPFNDKHPYFQPSLSGIVRAGISVPISDRVSFELLPTARYQFMNFIDRGLDLRESVENKVQKWSVGLDMGFMFNLSNKSQNINNIPRPGDVSVTYNLNDSEKPEDDNEKTTPKSYKNFAYAEFLGNGVMFFSGNYERSVYKTKNLSFQARLGLGYMPSLPNMSADNDYLYSVPFGVNMTIGNKYRKKLEVGAGASIGNMSENGDFTTYITPSLAYRLEMDYHLFFRLAVMVHSNTNNSEITPGIGISLGGCF